MLIRLRVEGFRNIEQAELNCAPGLNLIVGANASGKTSLLEAIYFLSRARSFRSQNPQVLIQHQKERLRVVATLQGAEGVPLTMGVERTPKQLTARIGGRDVTTLAELARALPVLLLNPISHRLLEGGPVLRRRFLDWGLFHQDEGFLSHWQRFNAALRHRNAALRGNAPDRSLLPWEREMASAAIELDRRRSAFCQALAEALQPLLGETLGLTIPELEYRRGWPLEADLAGVLAQGREQDRRRGHTRFGPQRADVAFKVDRWSALERFSRGQQKLFVIALVIAQAELYRRHRGRACTLLIDDLPAELDRHHRQRVMTFLAASSHQLFITAIESDALTALPWQSRAQFVITAGKLSKMV